MLLFPRCAVRLVVAVAVALALAGSSCATRPRSPVAPPRWSPPASVAVMGPPTLSAPELVAWFNLRQSRPSGEYRAAVPLDVLVQYYLEEGNAEGVAGDLAFLQGVVETGWFRFTGAVPPSKNNFAGLGATDTNGDAASFPDARTGVRAQIQHLRAYADATAVACAVPPLHNPCVDPRFALVVPKGKAPAWNLFGNGNWATASTYAASILSLYEEACAFNEVR